MYSVVVSHDFLCYTIYSQHTHDIFASLYFGFYLYHKISTPTFLCYGGTHKYTMRMLENRPKRSQINKNIK